MRLRTSVDSWGARWICTDCGYNNNRFCSATTKGVPPDVCPECGCLTFVKKVGRRTLIEKETFLGVGNTTVSESWEYKDTRLGNCLYCGNPIAGCKCGASQGV